MARNLLQIAFNKHKTIILCVDYQFANEIFPYLLDTSVISEFIKIKDVILEGLRNKHLYTKVVGISNILKCVLLIKVVMIEYIVKRYKYQIKGISF